MAFENKTIDEVYELIITGLEAELNTQFRLLPKSFIRVLAKVLSANYITLYKQQGWIYLQLFVGSASFDSVSVLGRTIRPLIEWGRLVGVGDPGEASPWKGSITVTTAAINTYLDAGAQLKSNLTGQIYITTETKLLANPTEVIAVQCATSGTVGNLALVAELQFVNPLANVEKKAVVTSVLTDGADAETEDVYRGRVRNRFMVQVQGGALADYRKWSSEVPEVYQTYIYSDTESATGIIIYVAGDPAVNPNRQVPASVLIAVGDSCTYDPITSHATRKPIGAVLDPAFNSTYANIRNVRVTPFDVAVTGFTGGDVSAFRMQAKSNLQLYFYGREPFIRGLSVNDIKNDVIQVNNLIGILNEIANNLGGYFGTVVMKKAGVIITEYSLSWGELCNLGTLTVNGALV